MPAPARLTLPRDGTGSASWWSDQLDWSADVRQKHLTDWRTSINAYRDELKAPSEDAIRVNIEYEKTEQKRGQLFFRNPELRLRPHPRTQREASTPDPATGQPRDVRKAVRVFREVLQRLAGPKGVDTKTLIDQNLFDVLTTGIMACKVGYTRTEDGKIPIQVGEEPAPGGQPGAILGLGAQPMVPVYEPAPNIIHEKYFASRISPARLGMPPDFTDGDYSRDADYLWHDFYVDVADAKRRGWRVPSDLKGSSSNTDDTDRLIPLEAHASRREQLKCREVFCWGSRFYADVKHPLQIVRLVFVHGVEEPVVKEFSTDQKWDPRGRLIGGITSLPIKVKSLRYVSDSPYPPSDCRISRRQGDELSEFRTQQVIHRRKSVPMRWMDLSGIVDEKVKELVKKGKHYEIIPTDGPGDKFMGEIARAQYPRENNAFIDQLMNDVDRQWALGANQQGIRSKGGTTATEVTAIQQATQTRLAGEQASVIAYWLSIMEHLGQCVQLYADREDYVELVGEQGAKEIEAWDKHTIKGEYLFDIVPDSQAQPDAAADRDLALNRYNLLANDPHINREELVRETVETYGGDPDRLIKPPEPPQQEKPKVSIAIKGEDLIPFAPQYANVVTLLQLSGIDAQMTAAQEPTGPAEVVDRERLRMAEADEGDGRSPGGLVGASA